MLSELAQELYELGKKALTGDENALLAFIDLYSDEYVDKLNDANVTKAEKRILFIVHTAGELCERQAKTPDELYEEENYTIYDLLEELKTWKIIEQLGELDKVQVIEEDDVNK